MNNKCIHNRRTLRKRVRRVIMISILVTMLLFSCMIIFAASQYIRAQSQLVTEYYCSSVALNINSKCYITNMRIDDLKKLGKPELTEWFGNLDAAAGSYKIVNTTSEISDSNVKRLMNKHDLSGGVPLLGPSDVITVTVSINNHSIIINSDNSRSSIFGKAIGTINQSILKDPGKAKLRQFIDWYVEKSQCKLVDSSGNTALTVTANTNYGFMMIVAFSMISIILLTALISTAIGLLLSRLLTIPVTAPLASLEHQISSAAQGDIMNARITLKKPLKEIESLAGSTNAIIGKMHEYNDLLQAQNEELEAQNEELTSSKKQIQDAQTLLVQKENMASIGQLTAAITHEINTPLGAINSNTQMCSLLLSALSQTPAAMDVPEIKELSAQLMEANNVSLMACKRVSEIIRSLKNFSKIDQAEFQEADLNEGIKSVVILTSNLWKNKVTMHENYGQLPMIKCFSGMMNQVFMNIIVNAIQSIEQKGEIFITTRADDKNSYISIRDTGIGITQENISKIFDSGFTTKRSLLGMGLGLSITRNIINKHHGNINVSSEPGRGTEFTIIIPLDINSPAEAEQ